MRNHHQTKHHSAYVPGRERLDQLSREAKSKKIIAVLRENIDLSKANILDIGTSAGYIAHALGKIAKSVMSVDIFDERKAKSHFRFVRVKGPVLPFPAKSFDLVISNHVIEHIPDQAKHLAEIRRVLKPGGLVYLATPNRIWPIETHYKLPLLTILPRRFANLYVRKVRGQNWNIYPLSYGDLNRLIEDKFELFNQIPLIIKDPARYKLDLHKGLFPLFSVVPAPVLNLLSRFSPTHIVILKKVR